VATSSQRFSDLGFLILRLGVGVHMVALHGWSKVQTFSEKAPTFADPLHIGSRLSLIAIIATEVGCAVLIILGLTTRLAAAALAFAMGVVAFVQHAHDPWRRRELALLYLLTSLTLVFTGPGRFSLDAAVWPRLRRKPLNAP
jgi:putative oxidoreductase